MNSAPEQSSTEEASRNLTNAQLTSYFISVAVMSVGLCFVVGVAGILIGIGLGGMIACAVAGIQSSISQQRAS